MTSSPADCFAGTRLVLGAAYAPAAPDGARAWAAVEPLLRKAGEKGVCYARAPNFRAALALTLLLPSVTALFPGAAWAQAAPADNWQFRATLYGYFPSISGSTAFPSDGTSVDVSADQIISNLKFTFMGSFEAQKGPAGVFTDLIYLNVGGSRSGTRDLTIGGVQLPVGITADASLDIKAWLWTVAGKYQMLSVPGQATLDVIAGARLISLNERLAWTFSGNVGPFVGPGRQGADEQSLNNWDGIVGVKGRLLGGDRAWFIPYYLDVGAGASEFTGQGILGVGYAFGWGDVVGAWRYVHYDFKSGKAIESLVLSGPGVGFVFRW
jgi:hypothetical protein